MACACRPRTGSKYEWTSADGTTKQVYNTLIEVKAKVMRVGGSYKPLTTGG